MARRVITSVMLVLTVGVVAVVVEHRSSGSAVDVATNDEASAHSEASSWTPAVAAARVGTPERARSGSSAVRLPSVPPSTVVLLAVTLGALLALMTVTPSRRVRQLALVPLRAPPARRTF